MLANSGYAAYANNKIMTASKGELTLMLYEGAIKFCNIAIAAVEQRDIQKAHINIIKVERIIEEFQSTLNMNICRKDLHRQILKRIRKYWKRF